MGKELLVIGNGFDLSIDARTSYSHFFESEYYKYTREKVSEWIWMCRTDTSLLRSVDMTKYSFSCWDIQFCLESEKDGALPNEANESINWCDVESVIHHSFTNNSRRSFSWKLVYDTLYKVFNDPNRFFQHNIFGKYFSDNNEAVNIIGMFLYCMNWKDKTKNLSCFYDSLLEELKKFETAFGQYILEETNNEEYKECAIKQVNKLVGTDRIIIDSFNYSDFSNDNIAIRHINGNCRDPIFGIDLNPKEESEYSRALCFTKTSRRVQQDAHNITRSVFELEAIDRAVVFGHSLNSMDYDYFNYLFTMLKFNTFEIEKMGSVEFVYNIYDPEKENEIRSKYAEKIYTVLSYYEQYVSKTNQHILINMLRFSGKLIIREL